MPLTKEQKSKIIEEMIEKFSRQKTAIFVNFQGLKAQAMTGLRKKLRENKIDFKVVKKTLLNLALKRGKTKIEIPELEGEIALAISYQDEIEPAKILYQFSRENENLKIVGGIIDKKFYSGEEIIALAKLPSRQEILAKLAVIIKAPLASLTSVLKGNLRNLVLALNAISKSK